ncbi:MAG TPA: M50 family metallopeptidase [Bryobacteraceae bacterium]|jgi:hypothetical protein|nr:M50 family metallopeptidase [Bryobacteraceae bacterium]
MSDTPVLDLEENPPKTRHQWAVLLFVVPISMAILLAPLYAGMITTSAPPFNGLLWIPAIYVAIAIHEIGHLFAGKLVGMDPGGISVGGFRFFKSGERWVFRFDGQWIGGFAKPLLTRGDFRRAPQAWMVAGGPIASLVFLAACSIAVVEFGGGTWDWIGTLFWGATISLASLIPYSGGGLKSDASLLWQLLKHPGESRRWIALLALQTEETKGALPREWDSELMKEALSVEESQPHFTYAQLWAFYRSADQRDTPAALRHLENALVSASRSGNKRLRAACFLEAAAATAHERNNAGGARIWLERSRKLHKPQSTAGVEAEIAMAEGRYEDAIRHWGGARDFIVKRRLDSGLARFAKERIAERESECRAAISRAETAGSFARLEDYAGAALPKQARPFPWLTIAAIAIAGIAILAVLALR